MTKGLPTPPSELNCKAPLSLDEFVTRCSNELSKPHSRLLSWEDCYLFFQEHFAALATGKDEDLLTRAEFQLGLYLASFGMYRGSSDLLELHRSVYRPLIVALCTAALENGVSAFKEITDHNIVVALAKKTKDSLQDLNISATPTLISKILMGTFACLPSFDQNLRTAVENLKTNPKTKDLPHVQNLSFGPIQGVEAWLNFANTNQFFFKKISPHFKSADRSYPTMRVVDLYLWFSGK